MTFWQRLRNRIVVVAVGAAVVLFMAVLGVFEALRRGEASDALERQAVVISDVVGEMVGGAVVEGDKARAAELLRGLVSRGQVLGVVVLDGNRRVLAAEPTWLRKDSHLS
ncbi:MAG TPA: CHASE sensor domain-containing protein, partial [Thermoanaerobaculaceae bacterium]|nr:CHASE sensor domain-containing protein [Thermoanaerobaculaceae bacterium]